MVRARAESKSTGARAGMKGKAAMIGLALGRDGATASPGTDAHRTPQADEAHAMAIGRPEEKSA